MKIQELAEILQQDLEEGKLSFIIYQVGRKWKYELYDTSTEKSRDESQKKYISIKHKVDDQAAIINGKKDFTDYDLKYIQNQLKKLRG